MDINSMRNIVILKNLPSNLVEEAFVVLKKNQKIKKLEYVENKSDNFSSGNNRENEDEYVVKEAELIISNYINTLESNNFKKLNNDSNLEKKYIKLKRVAYILGFVLVAGIIFEIFGGH